MEVKRRDKMVNRKIRERTGFIDAGSIRRLKIKFAGHVKRTDG